MGLFLFVEGREAMCLLTFEAQIEVWGVFREWSSGT